MSESNPSSDPPKPDIPKPNIPKPNIPKPNVPEPNIPKPNIPAPDVTPASSAPPVSAVESGAMEAPASKLDSAPEENSSGIDYTETLLPKRLLAGIIDGVLAGILMSVASAILPGALDNLAYLFAAAYLLLKDSLPFLDGQSVGKKIMKLRAVTAEGEPLTNNFAAGALRNVFVAFGPLALVELFVLHSREKAPNAGLRLGDDFAKTKVIREPEPGNSPE